MRVETIEVGNHKFTARIAGTDQGEMVLLLHGFPQTSYSYRHQLSALAQEGYYAVAFDQRGYSEGARPENSEAYQIKYLVEDVLAVAEKLGAKQFHLVGHDWGAALGWNIAANFPQKLLSYTALSVPHTDAFHEALANPECEQAKSSSYIDIFIQDSSEDILLKDERIRLKNMYQGIPPGDVEEYLRVLGNKSALSAALNWYRANLGPGVKQRHLGKVTVPTLYIWGTEDIALGQYAAESTEKYVQKGRYTFKPLDGSGHWLLESDSRLITELILKHIR